MPLRDYLYISQRKLLQLYPQLFRQATEPSRRLKESHVSVFGVGGGAQWDTLDPEVQARLEGLLTTVTKRLQELELIGTFDEPKMYVHDRMSVRYGTFRDIEPPVIFMAGASSRTIAALGGRLVHASPGLEERTGSGKPDWGLSEAHVARAIARMERLDEPKADGAPTRGLPTTLPLDQQWAEDVVRTYHVLNGPDYHSMQVETLARVENHVGASDLPEDVSDSKSVLVGAPLFISRIGPFDL